MDTTAVFNQIFSVTYIYFGYIVALLVFVNILKSSWFKGMMGEYRVNTLLKSLPQAHYHLVKNVTLPTTDGTTQIDHIVVSTFGLFVIETKNMKGWIFGKAGQKQWTQQIYRYKKKFQNPLHQNYKHTKTLEELLQLCPESIFSIIVFVGRSEFKTSLPDNVTYGRGCIDYIRSKDNPVFNQQQVAEIVATIQDGRLSRSVKTHIKHVQHVKGIVEEKAEQKKPPQESVDKSDSRWQRPENSVEPELKAPHRTDIEPSDARWQRPTNLAEVEPELKTPSKADTVSSEWQNCPKCGSAMMLRDAKKGKHVGTQFWGCTTFPKCRGKVEFGEA